MGQEQLINVVLMLLVRERASLFHPFQQQLFALLRADSVLVGSLIFEPSCLLFFILFVIQGLHLLQSLKRILRQQFSSSQGSLTHLVDLFACYLYLYLFVIFLLLFIT